MKKLCFFVLLGLLLTCVASWGLVVVDEDFEDYSLGVLDKQGSWLMDFPVYHEGNDIPASPWATYIYGAELTAGWAVVQTQSTAEAGGFLRVTNPGDGANFTRWKANFAANSGTGRTYAVRARLQSISKPGGGEDYAGLRNFTFEFNSRRIGVRIVRYQADPDHDVVELNGSGVPPVSYTLPDAGQWHVFHVTASRPTDLDPTGFKIFLDGAKTPIFAGEEFPEGGGTSRVMFGSDNPTVQQTIDFDFVRGANACYAPSPMVTDSPVDPLSGGAKAAKLGLYESGATGNGDTGIETAFPVVWSGGQAAMYIDVAAIGNHLTANNWGAYLILRSSNGARSCRVTTRFFQSSGATIAAGGDVVTNATAGVYYKLKLEIDITNRRFSAFVGDGIHTPIGSNVGHWGHLDGSGNLVTDGVPAVSNAGFTDATANDIASFDCLTYAYGDEVTEDAATYFDNVYVEGPSRYTPVFTAPTANCGDFPQFRFFTLTPSFTFEVDPHSALHVKVFEKAVVEGAGFDPDTSVAAWDSGVISSSVSSCAVTSPLLASDLGNPPSNIYYVFGRANLNETHAWGNWGEGVDFVCAAAPPVVPDPPAMTTPAAGFYLSHTPPTVAWTANGDWDQVQLLMNDITTLPATGYCLYGWKNVGSPIDLNTIQVGDPLADLPDLIEGHTYTVQVRVRKGCVGGPDGYESEWSGNTFTVFTTTPPVPTVDSPAGAYPTVKPVVAFTGQMHDAFQVKITSDSAGSTIVEDSGAVSSAVSGYNCTTALTVGNTYYAWAKVHNPIGWSDWSAASLFTIDRSIETTDIRHMDESGLLDIRVTAPNDMFRPAAALIPQGEGAPTEVTGVTASQPPCSPGLLRVADTAPLFGMLLRHSCPIDFNAGVTLVAAVRAWVGSNTSDVGEDWRAGSIIITDSVLGVGASVKVRPDQVSICVNGTDWIDAGLTPSNDFRVIRITAKAREFDNPSTIEWNVYADETFAVARTGADSGAITRSQFETGVGSWVTNQIAIGQGSPGLQGIFEYDWVAVNENGAYAPGDWQEDLNAYVPPDGATTRAWKLTGNTYASVTDAVKNGETGWATITASNAVINHVGTIAYYVQDAVTGAGSLKIDAVGNSADLGKALDDITGFLSSDGVLKVVKNSPVVNIASLQPAPLPYSALVSNIKSLGGSPCVTQLVDLGGPYVQNTGRLVKIFGTLPANPSDPADLVPGYPSGAQIFYVDDLSHPSWVLDGRDGELPGLRILLDLSYEPQIWDPFLSTGIGLGALVQIEGVSSLDDYITGGVIKTVRKIADPVITEIPK